MNWRDRVEFGDLRVNTNFKLPVLALTAGKTLTNESPNLVTLDAAAGFTVTLPAVESGLWFEFAVKTAVTSNGYVVNSEGADNVIYGESVTGVDGTATTSAQASDTITFAANEATAGDTCRMWCDGTNWYAVAVSQAAAGIVLSQAA